MLYAIAVSLAVGGQVTPLIVTGTLVVSYVGGIAVGVAVAPLAWLLLRRIRATLAINLMMLLVPFSAYLIAEIVHASGVLAVVVAGLIVAYQGPRITTAASRRQADAVWSFGVFLLNGALFILSVPLIILSVPLIATDGTRLDGRDEIVFITAGVILLSLLVLGPLLPAVMRWAHYRRSRRGRRVRARRSRDNRGGDGGTR